MIALALTALSIAAVSLASGGADQKSAKTARWQKLLAGVLGAIAITAACFTWGPGRGVAASLLLAMVSSSVLVLLLAPRPKLSLPVGLAGGAVGILALSASIVQPLASYCRPIW